MVESVIHLGRVLSMSMATTTSYLELIDQLAAEGNDAITTHDLAERGELTPQAASNLLTRLVDRGLLDRVARGHFVMRPFGALGTRAAAEDITLAVGAVFGRRLQHRIAFIAPRSTGTASSSTLPAGWTCSPSTSDRGCASSADGPCDSCLEQTDHIEIAAIDAGHRARAPCRRPSAPSSNPRVGQHLPVASRPSQPRWQAPGRTQLLSKRSHARSEHGAPSIALARSQRRSNFVQ